MRRISGTQTRTQREQQRKYTEKLTQSRSKTVEFNEKSSFKLKKPSRPNPFLFDSEMEQIRPQRIKSSRSSRSGLLPSSTYNSTPPVNVDSDTGSEAISSTPTTPGFVSQFRIPSVTSSHLRQYAYSTPVKESFSVIGDDVFDENAIEVCFYFQVGLIKFLFAPYFSMF